MGQGDCAGEDGAGGADERPPPDQQQPSPQQEDEARQQPLLKLEHYLPYRLSVLASTVGRVLSRIYEREHGLSVAEWRLLAVLARFGPLSANSVADRTAMDKVRVSRAVARAAANGLIERRIDAYDRRRSVLTLTPEGRAVHDRIVPLARAREAEILDILTPAELASFNEMGNRLLIHAIQLDREASLPKRE